MQKELQKELEEVAINFSRNILGILKENIVFDEDLPFIFDINNTKLNYSQNYDSFVRYSSWVEVIDKDIKTILRIYSQKFEGRLSFFFFHELKIIDSKLTPQVKYCNNLKSIILKKEKYVQYLKRIELIRQLNSFFLDFLSILLKILNEENMQLFYNYIGNQEEYDKLRTNTNLQLINQQRKNKTSPYITSNDDLQYNNFTKIYTDYPTKIRNPKLKVLFIAPGYDNLLLLSGVSKVARDLVLALAKYENIEVHTIMCWFNPTKYYLLKNSQLFTYKSLQELLNSTSELEYDLIHFHTFTLNDFKGSPELNSIINYYSKDEYKIPIVYTIHSDEINEKNTYLTQGADQSVMDFKEFTIVAQQGLLNIADKIIHLTNYNLIQLVNNFNTLTNLKEKSIVIHNMINTLDIKKFKKLRNKQNDTFELTYLGRLSPEKGIYEMAKIFKNIITQLNKKVILNIIGGGTPETETALKQQFGNSINQVKFWGFQSGDNKEKILANSDALIVPSRVETFGLVVAEGILREIPIIATKLPAFEELFGNNITLYLNESGNLQENIEYATNKLTQFINNYNNQNNNTLKNNRKFIETNYSEKAIANKHYELYKQITINKKSKLIELYQEKSKKYGIKKLEKAIHPIISKLINSDVQIKKIKRLTGGLNNGAFAIYLNNGQKLALKIYKQKSIDKNILNIEDSKEHNVYEFLHRKCPNLKMPKSYYYGHIDSLNRNIIIFELLEGNSLNKIGHLMKSKNYADVYFSIGQTLRSIHQNTQTHICGWIEDSPESMKITFNSWFEFLKHLFNKRLELLYNQQLISSKEVEIITQYLESKKNILKNQPMCLLHNDLWYENFIITVNNLLLGRYELAGLIDVERAMIGDPILDIVRMKEWMDDIYPQQEYIYKSLLQGYNISENEILELELLYKINLLIDNFYVRGIRNFRINPTTRIKFDKLIEETKNELQKTFEYTI